MTWGFLKKGTTVKFTGFCVRRNYWESQPFVYGEVMSGESAGKTFDAERLVRTEKTYEHRRAWMVDIDHEAVRLSFAPAATLDPVKTD